jgi:hypothetical protein
LQNVFARELQKALQIAISGGLQVVHDGVDRTYAQGRKKSY